ncbi:GDP-mannose 4,6-dehydratase [Mycobacterium conspicuum]
MARRPVAHSWVAYRPYVSPDILFIHGLPLRPERVAKKCAAAVRIVSGDRSRLALGNINIKRGWDLPPEYVDAAWRTRRESSGSDFALAAGGKAERR